jgi:His-Xaa-Ser system radical SAM maturase HxsC
MSGAVVRRHTYGETEGEAPPFIGIACLRPIKSSRRGDHVRVIANAPESGETLDGYGAILTDLARDGLRAAAGPALQPPTIDKAAHVEHVRDGDILRLDFRRGFVRSLYRVGSPHNVIFATDQCNSNCLMCSQPPKDVDDSEMVNEHLRLISLIPPSTKELGITGGEPTLLGEGIFRILQACKEVLPVTRLHMLTNGRLFYYRQYAQRLAEVDHRDLTLGIPVYSDRGAIHDYVVQAKGSFDQTLVGLHNLARYGRRIEIRVVIHKQTYQRLPQLAEFLYRNCPFAVHVALMGLELMGYTKTNLQQLWIDPFDYQDELEAAVTYLSRAGMNVSIYNHQLCVLRRTMWPYARKSISDYKNIYLDACQQCSVLDRCGGLFKSAERIHSEHIASISA